MYSLNLPDKGTAGKTDTATSMLTMTMAPW